MSMEYNTALFDGNIIDNMIVHFKNIVKEIVNEPKVNISDVYFLSNEETMKIYDSNQTENSYTSSSIDEIISQKSLNSPSQTAVICGNETLTYIQLEEQSAHIANVLSTLPHSNHIAVCLPRSVSIISSALAIWKVGSVYVP